MGRILVTGGAGFIGSHLARRLFERGDSVVVLDNLDPYYDVAIKRRNLANLEDIAGGRLTWIEGDIRDASICGEALQGVDGVIHLAALAGVRPSLAEPSRYMDVNVRGTQVLLDAWRDQADAGRIGRTVPFVFGSSSSVYGGNEKVPFSEEDAVDEPISPYASSKRAGELLAFTFHHLTESPVACLRFFTVYGPGQRPEMAIHKFCRLIVRGEPLPFYGDGSTRRDYTFVSDIIDGVVSALDRAKGYRIYNLGGAATTTLAELVQLLESALGRTAALDRQPEQPGDVEKTHADVRRAQDELGYVCKVPIAEGLRRFVDWYSAEHQAGRLP